MTITDFFNYLYQCGKIHGTVKQNLLPKFEALLEEGSTYSMENLLVSQNDLKLKTTTHKYKLTFMGNTKCNKTDVPNIPLNYFQFVPFTQILDGINQDFLIGK